MQTFLPYPNFSSSAKVLDRQRLGKQRVENLQIMKALLDPGYGWQNHPAVNMWRGYEQCLFSYQEAVVVEWLSRGYKDTCYGKTLDLLDESYYGDPNLPDWLGDERLHASHRSNLLRKDAKHYSQWNWPEGPDLPYFWPV